MRSRRKWWILSGVLVITALAIFALTPFGGKALGHKDFVFGLDLKGGVYVELEAQLPPGTDSEQAKAYVDGAINKIKSRVDALGVTEPIIQSKVTEGKNLIVVQLPGITDTDEAIKLIRQVAFLEFKVPKLESDGHAALDEQGRLQWLSREEVRAMGELITSDNLKRAVVDITQFGEPQVRLDLDSEGRLALEKISTRLIQDWKPTFINGVVGDDTAVATTLQYPPMGIFLDDKLVSWPVFSQGPISADSASTPVIEVPNVNEATTLTIQLNSGALQIPLKETGDRRDVDPTLGPKFIRQALLAGVIGLGLILMFMAIYYRLPGLLSGGSLLIYVAIVLAIFKLIPVTLTLAGLAGFIVSIGMAVDANVLIFERLTEELRAGRTLGAAVEAGFARAWSSIWDSNVTTFIVCGILIWLGSWLASPPVQGFGLTLLIGVAASMFTAIFVTRSFLRVVAVWRPLQVTRLYARIREKQSV